MLVSKVWTMVHALLYKGWSFDRLTLTTNLKELNRKAKEETPKSILSLFETGFTALFTYFVLRNTEFPGHTYSFQMQIKKGWEGGTPKSNTNSF